MSLGRNYTKSLDNLPKSLKYFVFFPNQFMYNNKEENFINSLEKIKCEHICLIDILCKDIFISKLKKLNNIKCLKLIGNLSLNYINENIPDSIERLTLNIQNKHHTNYYDKNVWYVKKLPSDIKYLQIDGLEDLNILRNLPENLISLNIQFGPKIVFNNNNLSNLPVCLKKLMLDFTYVDERAYPKILNLNELPDSLNLLELTDVNFYQLNLLDNLPASIKYINIIITSKKIYSIGEDIEINIFNNLPIGVEELKIICQKFKTNLIKELLVCVNLNNLPSNLKKITLSNNISYQLDTQYPNLEIIKQSPGLRIIW